MTKKYGHTGTLFIQAGKYKWSYRHDFCIKCKGVQSKHKGKGLCTKCFDKERKLKSKQRRINLQLQNLKWYYRNRISIFLVKKQHKKKKKNWTDEDYKKYKKDWYNTNKEAILLMNKAKRMVKNGKACMKILIKGEEVYLPYISMERPASEYGLGWANFREKERQFLIIKQFFLNKDYDSVVKYKIDDKIAHGHSKPVIQISLDGEIISNFNSIKEASLSTGANENQIGYVCKGKAKTAGGYKWEYYNIENKKKKPY